MPTCDSLTTSFSGDATKRKEPRAFQNMPIEINQQIGLAIENDKDIANFAAVCANTADAIYGNSRYFWRMRFQSKFDAPTEAMKERVYLHNGVYELVYTEFRYPTFVSRAPKFKCGLTFKERHTLMEMATVLNDARPTITDAKDGEVASRNIKFLHEFIFRYGSRRGNDKGDTFGLLDNVCRTGYDFGSHTQQLAAFQLCFADLHLGLTAPHANGQALTPSWGWYDSRAHAYRERTHIEVTSGSYSALVKFDFVDILHIVNYFKPFLTGDEWLATKDYYTQMGNAGLPHAWTAPSSHEGSALGSKWRGTYGYLDPKHLAVIRLRGRENYLKKQDEIYDCHIDGANGDPFQIMNVAMSDDPAVFALLKRFERYLHNNINQTSPEKMFTFTSDSNESGSVYRGVGCLSPMETQHEIRGFQRMTMMKYYTTEYGQIDDRKLWAYEGVVLPGGNMMVGRWWRAQTDPALMQTPEESGPFIYWNIPDKLGRTRGKTPEDGYDVKDFTNRYFDEPPIEDDVSDASSDELDDWDYLADFVELHRHDSMNSLDAVVPSEPVWPDDLLFDALVPGRYVRPYEILPMENQTDRDLPDFIGLADVAQWLSPHTFSPNAPFDVGAPNFNARIREPKNTKRKRTATDEEIESSGSISQPGIKTTVLKVRLDDDKRYGHFLDDVPASKKRKIVKTEAVVKPEVKVKIEEEDFDYDVWASNFALFGEMVPQVKVKIEDEDW